MANWWAWEMVPSKVGWGPRKYQAQQGGSMETLWAGTSPTRSHQPARFHWRNFSEETYLSWYLPWTTSLWAVEGAGCWFGKIGDQSSDPQSSTEQANCKYGNQSSDPTKIVIHKDQRSRQLQIWRLELTFKHVTRQALVATPQIKETTGRIGSRLT